MLENWERKFQANKAWLDMMRAKGGPFLSRGMAFLGGRWEQPVEGCLSGLLVGAQERLSSGPGGAGYMAPADLLEP